VFRTTAGPTAVLSAAIKQEPGSPTAHSPASSAPAAGNSSPTPELSAPPPEEQSGRASAAGGRFKLPAPSPLPPPDASEGPGAAAEYARYLERWEEGNTLAQRWYRSAVTGYLDSASIVARAQVRPVDGLPFLSVRRNVSSSSVTNRPANVHASCLQAVREGCAG
jgi:hypothetical protein